MNRFRREGGQFIPISAMVMLTIVVMMVAVVNVYKVTRAKLQVQNITEAAALNLAGQEEHAFNIVSDRNEWLNHMMAGIPTVNRDPNVLAQLGGAAVKNCNEFFKKIPIARGDGPVTPGISCIENTVDTKGLPTVPSRHIFHTEDGAKNYADLVKIINDAQRGFVDAYNSFLGARSAQAAKSASSLNGPADFWGQLTADIPALTNPNLACTAWNSQNHEQNAVDQINNLANNPSQIANSNAPPLNMDPLSFRVHHDIEVRYYKAAHTSNGDIPDQYVETTSLGKEAGVRTPHGVGWMVPDDQKMPKIDAASSAGAKTRVGVGFACVEKVDTGVGSYPVTARAKAFLVEDSGSSGVGGSDSSPLCPPGKHDCGPGGFKPTYWVKLAPEPK